MVSLLLALCMALALLPGTAGAEEDGVMPLMVAGDNTPPVVSGISMDNPGRTVRPGDKLDFWVAVEDESGIDMGSSMLTFSYTCNRASPFGGHRHEVYAWGDGQSGGFYDEDAGLAHFELTIMDDMENGEYTLISIEIQDIYGNIASLYLTVDPEHPGEIISPGGTDFLNLTFTIEGASEGSHPPILPDHETNPPVITSLSMEEPGRTVRTGDMLEFYVAVEDESGIDMWFSRFYFSYTCDEGQDHFIAVGASGGWSVVLPAGCSYDAEAKLAKFSLQITDDMMNGTYTLSHIDLVDMYGNVAMYYDLGAFSHYGNLREIAGYESIRFTVSGLPHDHEPPTVYSVSMEEPGQIVTAGDTLTSYVSTEDTYGLDIARSSLDFMCTCHPGPYSSFPTSPDLSPDPSISTAREQRVRRFL